MYQVTQGFSVGIFEGDQQGPTSTATVDDDGDIVLSIAIDRLTHDRGGMGSAVFSVADLVEYIAFLKQVLKAAKDTNTTKEN